MGTDRYGNSDKAMQITDDEACDSIEFPPVTMNDLESFTVSFWVNIDRLPTSNPCFFSVSSSTNSEELVICAEHAILKTVRMDYTTPITSLN